MGVETKLKHLILIKIFLFNLIKTKTVIFKSDFNLTLNPFAKWHFAKNIKRISFVYVKAFNL